MVFCCDGVIHLCCNHCTPPKIDTLKLKAADAYLAADEIFF